MAVNDSRPAEKTGASAPLWISLVYLAGLAFLYLARRVMLDAGGLAIAVSILGVTAVGLATVARFLSMSRGRDDQAPIGWLLSSAQLVGILGVLLWWLTTEGGRGWVGLSEGDSAISVLTVAWVFCIAVSVLPLLFAEFALQPMRDAPALEGRRVRFAATSGLALALAVTYGSLFVYAATQAGAQADFSYFKTSEPSPDTVRLTQRLSEPLEVVGFFPEVNAVQKEVEAYLSALKARSANLNYTFVDRYLEPQKARDLRVTQDGTIVLVSGKSKHPIPIGTELAASRSKLVSLDKEVNAGLGDVARPHHTVYLTVGHGELNDINQSERKAEGRTAELLHEILEQENFDIRELGINQGSNERVPDDADLVMVLGPVHPFTPAEIRSLATYANGGGRLLLALDLDATVETNMPAVDPPALGDSKAKTQGTGGSRRLAGGVTASKEHWLSDLAATVGAGIEPTVLADETEHVIRFYNDSDRSLLRTSLFSSHPSVSTLSINSLRAAVVAFGASPIIKPETGGYTSDVAVRSYDSSFGDKNGNFKLDEGELMESYPLALAITKQAPDPLPPAKGNGSESKKTASSSEQSATESEEKPTPTKPEMRAFVLGDADALSDLVLDQLRANRILVLDAVRWLVDEESLAGQMESEQDVTIAQTKQLDLAWFYLTIFGIPAFVLAAGLTISSRARRTALRHGGSSSIAGTTQLESHGGKH